MDEQKTQTFAEWLLDFVKAHPNACVTISQGCFGEFTIDICDISKGRPIKARNKSLGIEYEASKLTIDEIFIDTAERLEKEIENYGK